MAKLEFDDEGSRLVEEFNASAGATHGSRSNTGGGGGGGGGVRKLTRQLEHIVDEDVDSVVIAPIDERADRSLIFIGKTGDLPGPLLTCYLNREICHVN